MESLQDTALLKESSYKMLTVICAPLGPCAI